MTLITTPNLRDADGTYALLLSAHKGLTEPESHAMNARLILILMNHIGTHQVLDEAFRLAREPSGA